MRFPVEDCTIEQIAVAAARRDERFAKNHNRFSGFTI
jgi:hypothetical protein